MYNESKLFGGFSVKTFTILIILMLLLVGCGSDESLYYATSEIVPMSPTPELIPEITPIPPTPEPEITPVPPTPTRTPAPIRTPFPLIPPPEEFPVVSYTIIVPPTYNILTSFVNGYAIAMFGEVDWNFAPTWCHFMAGKINTLGEIVIPIIYSDVGHFSEGLAWVRQHDGFLYGFVDTSGQMVIEPQFVQVTNFSDGVASVAIRIGNNQRGWGVIDTQGNEIVPFVRNATIGPFQNGRALISWAHTGNRHTGAIITPTGELIAEGVISRNVWRPFPYGLLPLSREGRFGFIDTYDGSEAIPFIYNSAFEFSEGLAMVHQGGYRGFIDTVGNVVVPIYERARCFSDGMAIVGIELLSETNNTFDAWTSGDYYHIQKWGVIDSSGRKIVPFIYDEITDFSEGLAGMAIWCAESGRHRWGFIDNTGYEVVPPTFCWVGPFSEGFAVVNSGAEHISWAWRDGLHNREFFVFGGTFKLIDRWGNIVLTFEDFDAVGGHVSNGMLTVGLNDELRWVSAIQGYLPTGGIWGFIKIEQN